MAKRKGLPKKYAKMGFKRGWRAYKRTLKPARVRRTTTRKYPIRARGKTMARRRKYFRRAKGTLMNKQFLDGLFSAGGKFALKRFVGSNPLYEAGLDIGLGLFRHNKTLLAQGIVNGVTSFLPSLNLGGGNGGGVR